MMEELFEKMVPMIRWLVHFLEIRLLSRQEQKIGITKYGHHPTLGRSGGQTVDTWSIIRLPLKSLGYNGSH